MSERTGIEWCDSTFNPWMGCTRVSPACDDCYAARSTPARTLGIEWGSGQPRRRTSEANWKLPERWEREHQAFFAEHGRRRRVFCASLADVFDNEVPWQWRANLFELIRVTPNLDWLLLTKRPQNIVRMVRSQGAIAGNGTRYLPDNAWLGTTAEDQRRANMNVPSLLQCRELLGARVLFVSIEPMLSPVDLTHIEVKRRVGIDVFDALEYDGAPDDDVDFGTATLDWVICGGESGPKARPMRADWARSLRDQCAAAGVPFLFKQWGEFAPEGSGVDAWHVYPDGTAIRDPLPPGIGRHVPEGHWRAYRVGKKAAGRLLDGAIHDGSPGAVNR